MEGILIRPTKGHPNLVITNQELTAIPKQTSSNQAAFQAAMTGYYLAQDTGGTLFPKNKLIQRSGKAQQIQSLFLHYIASDLPSTMKLSLSTSAVKEINKTIEDLSSQDRIVYMENAAENKAQAVIQGWNLAKPRMNVKVDQTKLTSLKALPLFIVFGRGLRVLNKISCFFGVLSSNILIHGTKISFPKFNENSLK